MNTFAVLVLCVQACLVQSVLSHCASAGYGARVIAPAPAVAPALGCGGAALGYGGVASGLLAAGLGYPGALGYEAAGLSAYGGSGEGNVGVIGELPVAGNTAVIGQVPIMGAVGFGGSVPAQGCVSITGKCSCGCGCY